MNNNERIAEYPTEKLLADRHEFEVGAAMCRLAMLFDVLVARALDEREPDYLDEATELLDVLHENELAIKLIDQELRLRLIWGIISPTQYELPQEVLL